MKYPNSSQIFPRFSTQKRKKSQFLLKFKSKNGKNSRKSGQIKKAGRRFMSECLSSVSSPLSHHFWHDKQLENRERDERVFNKRGRRKRNERKSVFTGGIRQHNNRKIRDNGTENTDGKGAWNQVKEKFIFYTEKINKSFDSN